MASKIVKAFKQAKSALRSSEALEEPEIVAVVPPPLPPKRSQPPLAAPLPPASDSAPHTPQQQQQQQQQSSPPLSPVLYQLENTSLADQPKKQGGGALEFVAELPDTSVPRPDEAKLAAAPEQTQDRADPTTGQPKAKQPEPDKVRCGHRTLFFPFFSFVPLLLTLGDWTGTCGEKEKRPCGIDGGTDFPPFFTVWLSSS